MVAVIPTGGSVQRHLTALQIRVAVRGVIRPAGRPGRAEGRVTDGDRGTQHRAPPQTRQWPASPRAGPRSSRGAGPRAAGSSTVRVLNGPGRASVSNQRAKAGTRSSNCSTPARATLAPKPSLAAGAHSSEKATNAWSTRPSGRRARHQQLGNGTTQYAAGVPTLIQPENSKSNSTTAPPIQRVLSVRAAGTNR